MASNSKSLALYLRREMQKRWERKCAISSRAILINFYIIVVRSLSIRCIAVFRKIREVASSRPGKCEHIDISVYQTGVDWS